MSVVVMAKPSDLIDTYFNSKLADELKAVLKGANVEQVVTVACVIGNELVKLSEFVDEEEETSYDLFCSLLQTAMHRAHKARKESH